MFLIRDLLTPARKAAFVNLFGFRLEGMCDYAARPPGPYVPEIQNFMKKDVIICNNVNR